MKQIFTLCFIFLNLQFLWAAPGDTTIVRVHDKTHWDWYGTTTLKGNFPDGSKSYAKVWMRYTLGCPSSGCSDWDYTTQIFVRNYINDSTFTKHELGRVITPYGGYLNKNWQHNFMFDVTDYAHFLVDSAEIEAHYSGWSDGFTVITDFIFIEGTPPRNVLKNNVLANGSFFYGDSARANSCEKRTAPQPIEILASAKTFKIKATPTGHGFNGNGYDPGNPDNCSEFCSKWFEVNIDGGASNRTTIWKDDCGKNPLFRQNGTWIYNRAGWCPGGEGVLHEFEVTDHLTAGTTQQIGFNWQFYRNTSPNNSSYTFFGELIQYGDFNYSNEAELIEILKPSTNENHSRINPTCSQPIIKIKNNGSNNLTSLDIVIGLKGFNNTITYNWSGNLEFNQTELIELPINGWLISKNFQYDIITVELKNPNGSEDESKWNNYMESKFQRMPPTNGVHLWLKTNNFPQENRYAIFDDLGNMVYERRNLPINSQLRDTFDLPDGCYTLTLYDSDCDGLFFPFNNPPYTTNNPEGNGFAQIWRNDGGQLTNLEANFGCEISASFTVGKGYSGDAPELTQVIENEELNYFSVYPNPSKQLFNVEMALPNNKDAIQVQMISVFGNLVYQKSFGGDFIQTQILAEGLNSGVYFLQVFKNHELLKSEKLIVQ